MAGRNYSALSAAGAASAGAFAAASSAAFAAAAAANSAFFLATSSAFALFASFSASRRAFSAALAASLSFVFTASTEACLFFNQAWNFVSAAASSNAPFFTPSNKCFFMQTPSRERMLRVVSVGCAPTCNQYKALSKFKSTVAGLVFGL